MPFALAFISEIGNISLNIPVMNNEQASSLHVQFSVIMNSRQPSKGKYIIKQVMFTFGAA